MLEIFIDENTTRSLVQRVFNSAKASVFQRFDSEKGKMLETELYLEWLIELDYLVSAVKVRVNQFFGTTVSSDLVIKSPSRQRSPPRSQVHENE